MPALWRIDEAKIKTNLDIKYIENILHTVVHCYQKKYLKLDRKKYFSSTTMKGKKAETALGEQALDLVVSEVYYCTNYQESEV